MKIGEIKLEALKLMDINREDEINMTNIEELYSDEKYSTYLNKMEGSINRALQKIAIRGLLPQKEVTIKQRREKGNGDWVIKTYANNREVTQYTFVEEYRTRYNYKSIIPDILRLERVSFEGDYDEYIGAYSYTINGDNIILPTLKTNEKYCIVYKPKAPYITSSSDASELAIPQELAVLIPLYIKAELYEEDEPNIAQSARANFEKGLVEQLEMQQPYQSKVRSIYEQY